MTWLEEVVLAFEELGGKAHVQELYTHIGGKRGTILSITERASIRKNIEYYSADSKAFLGKVDLFESVNGINRGVWKLHDGGVVMEAGEELEKFPDRRKYTFSRIIRSTYIVDELKKIYSHKCQVCGLSLGNLFSAYSEGHHIHPLGKLHNGPDIPSNIFILCPNHHAEFDLGAIALDPKTKRIMHIESRNFYMGKSIEIKHDVNNKYLAYHIDNIFGKIGSFSKL